MTTTLLARAVERQNNIWQQMTEITAIAEREGRDLTAEERTKWDAAEADLTTASSDIERFERQAKLEKIDRGAIIAAGGGEKKDPADERTAQNAAYAAAFKGFMRGGMDRLTGEQRMLLAERHVELRDQGTGVDTAGGYLVPDEYRNTITETMKAYGGLLGFANVVPTSSGADLMWPTNDDTSNEGEILGENAQAGSQDVTLGGRKLKAYTFSSKIVRVSLMLLQDSAFNLDAWLPSKLGQRIGRRAARSFTTGTGVDQPEGITTNCAVGKQGAGGQVTSVIYDDLVDLEHSVDPAYRPNARYLMGDGALKVIRKLKDSQQRPLWVPIPAPGFPSTINGFPYTIDPSMPAMAASAKSIVFGDLNAGYVIRQVLEVQMMRLTERYADYLQVGFLGFSRMDGGIDDAAAIRSYQNAAS